MVFGCSLYSYLVMGPSGFLLCGGFSAWLRDTVYSCSRGNIGVLLGVFLLDSGGLCLLAFLMIAVSSVILIAGSTFMVFYLLAYGYFM